MNLIARLRRFFAPPQGWPARRVDDWADMGTAFGLDATTTLQPESAAEVAARERAAKANRMQYRLHRRSTF